jgi:Uma2 family endonuclease
MLTRPHVERIPMSKEEYFRRAQDRDECLVDWEEGVAIKLTPAHGRHSLFILHLSVAMKDALLSKGQLWPEIFVDFGSKTYGPDIVVLFGDHVALYREGRICGAPDIVVEVLSDDSITRDRVEKFDSYCKLGVPWYWIGDPAAGNLEEYKNTPEGYVRTASGTLDMPFRPRALEGLEVDMNHLVKPGFP